MRRNESAPIDIILLGIVGLLSLAGLVFLYSSSAMVSTRTYASPHEMFIRQAIKLFLGVVLLVLACRVDYKVFKEPRWCWALWGGTTLLLVLLLFPNPLRMTVRDTNRWLGYGSLTIQPSEFARVSLLLVLASLSSRLPTTGPVWRRALPFVLAVGVPLGLVLVHPNFGTALAMGISALGLLVLAGMPWKLLTIGGLSLAGAVAVLLQVFPYPLRRIRPWMDGLRDWTQHPDQIREGFIALGSGGWLGVGLGESVQKRQFVPDPHTDLILAIIGEEVGFVGLALLFLLFGFLLWRGFLIAVRAPDTMGFLLAAGITAQIGLYLLINAAVVTGLFPVTGLPLPFVSYGGSALWANLISVGLLISVSRASSWQAALARQRVSQIRLG